MLVGVPTEIKEDEYRVSLTPAGARELAEHGHEVLVQAGAGEGSAIPDDAYSAQGAQILPDEAAVFDQAEMILGVKEPQPVEVEMLRPEHTLFTYLHLAPAPELTMALQASGATCIAYETVEDSQGRLPLLAPMSEVAGKIATQAGAFFLEKPLGGRGILLGGVPGVAPAKVVVLGGGIVGYNAALVAVGMKADVWVLDKSVERMRELESMLAGRITLAMSTKLELEEAIADADLVVGAVLIPGARAPKLITRAMLGLMKPGSVIVDVAIDQGGCTETSRPTTHSDPIYVVDSVVHYCVANMPGAVPITSTKALTNVTLPYVEAIAERGLAQAVARDAALARGVNVLGGTVTYQAVADAHGLDYRPLDELLQAAAG
jgi:alanine dehydrogenase